ncbi:MAG: TonB-dependent receptor plug domain-containing protein [Stellaceae bacterium]
MFRLSFVAALALLGVIPAIAPASAQQPEFPLPPMVVSATEIPTPQSQLGSDVTVITAADIARHQWRTLPQVLRSVPGVTVGQAGGPGSATSVFIQGANANHTKVLIDGIDVSDPSSPDGAFDFSQILVSDIARIEVLRGPQSALYGSEAIGGVIMIETKKGQGPPHVTGTLEGGSFGTFNQRAGLSGATNIFHYEVNAQHLRAADTPVTPADLLPPGAPRQGNLSDIWNLSSRLGAEISPTLGANLALRYDRSLLDYTGEDDLTYLPAAEQSQQQEQQIFTRGELNWTPWAAFQNRFGIAYTDDRTRQFDGTAFEIGTPPISDTTGHRYQGDWRGIYTLAPQEKLLFGTVVERDDIVASPISAENGDEAGFAEWQGRLFPGLHGVASLRYDHNDRFGGIATWHIAPSYTVAATGTQLKLSAGTGFKAPTLNQLFVSYPSFGFSANPDLRPEQSLGIDAGFVQPVLGGRLRFGARYFHNDIRNLIDYNDTYTTLVNIGHATTQGVETFADVAVTKRFGLRASYTYTLAIDDDTGAQLLRRPKHTATLGAHWHPFSRLGLAASVIYVGARPDVTYTGLPGATAKPYWLIDLDADYRLSRRVALFGRIDNLLDQHYEDIVGFLRPGLGVYGGIKVSFDVAQR